MASGPAEFSIRPFKITDLDEVYRIEKATFPKPWTKPSFILFHYKEPKGFKVAVVDNRIAGYAIITIEKNSTEPFQRVAHLVNLAVHSDFRRRRIGQRLLEEILDYASDMGVRKIELEVSALNLAAKELYQKFGFVEKGIIKEYYGKDEDAIIMVKEHAKK